MESADQMLILAAFLCVSYTNAYYYGTDIPYVPFNPVIPSFMPIDTRPRLYAEPIVHHHHPELISDDLGPHQSPSPNIISYWPHSRPSDTESTVYHYEQSYVVPSFHSHEDQEDVDQGDGIVHDPITVVDVHENNSEEVPDVRMPVLPDQDHPDQNVFPQTDQQHQVLPDKNMIPELLQPGQNTLPNFISPPGLILPPMNHLNILYPSIDYYSSLASLKAIRANLEENIRVDRPISILDAKSHFNAMAGVILTLAEHSQSPTCIDFDAYFEDNYLPTLERYYVNGLSNPKAVSDKIVFYIDLVESKMRILIDLIEESCKSKPREYCNAIVQLQLKIDRVTYPLQTRLFAMVCDLAKTYYEITPDLESAAEGYQDISFMLKNKALVGTLAKKIHNVIETVTKGHVKHCKEEFLPLVPQIVPQEKKELYFK